MSTFDGENDSAYRGEARTFGMYLLKEPPSDAAASTYADIISQAIDDTAQQDRLLNFALQHPWSIPFLDSAAALFRPESELRRRLHIMFAVLECQPRYSDDFLPIPHPKAYALVIALVGCKAALKAACGLVLIKALRA